MGHVEDVLEELVKGLESTNATIKRLLNVTQLLDQRISALSIRLSWVEETLGRKGGKP